MISQVKHTDEASIKHHYHQYHHHYHICYSNDNGVSVRACKVVYDDVMIM
jgi:hypothetical protein